jgi:glucokinase
MAIRRTGPLENIIGGKGIEQAWLKMPDGTRPGDQSRQHLKATEIFDLAESGDAKARELLQHTAQILASAITNVSLILDSSLVIFGGGVGSHPALLEATKRIVDQNEFARPHLAVSLLGADAQLHGAIWLALKTAEQNVLH